MVIIGIHGAIGHGKSAFACTLIDAAGGTSKAVHIEASDIIVEVANFMLTHLESASLKGNGTDNLMYANTWLNMLPEALKDVTHLEQAETTIKKRLQINQEDVAQNPNAYNKLWRFFEDTKAHPELLDVPITQENKGQYRDLLQWLGSYMVYKLKHTVWFDEIITRGAIAKQEGAKLLVVTGVRYPDDADVIRKSGGYIIEVIRPGYPVPDANDPTEVHRVSIVSDSKVYNSGTLDQLSNCASQVLGDMQRGRLKREYRMNGE